MTTKNAKNELDNVKEDLSALRTDLRNLSEALLDSAKDKASAAGEAVADRAARGRDALHDVLSRLRRGGEDAAGTVKETVQSHPAVTLAGAFGLGFILGKLLDRS